MENPIKMEDDWEYPYFRTPNCYGHGTNFGFEVQEVKHTMTIYDPSPGARFRSSRRAETHFTRKWRFPVTRATRSLEHGGRCIFQRVCDLWPLKHGEHEDFWGRLSLNWQRPKMNHGSHPCFSIQRNLVLSPQERSQLDSTINESRGGSQDPGGFRLGKRTRRWLVTLSV